MKLEEMISGFDFYQKRFSEWEADEKIFDDQRAFWELRKPGSQSQKVCLYRDGCNMFVYGDYGQFTFDSMTWLGSVYNLEYDNIGYQMEKLNCESRKSLTVFDDSKCIKTILEWLRERLDYLYSIPKKSIDKIIDFLDEQWIDYEDDVRDFCRENGLDDCEDICVFAFNAIKNADEDEWISFLRRTDFSDFDEECESCLWNAGERISQRYFICMYALKVCKQKLEEMRKE